MSQLKEFHVSVMSGNTVKFGHGLIDADWTRITLLGVILLGSVVADGVLGTVVAIAGRRRAPVVLLLAAPILAVPLAHLSPAVTAFTAAIGALPAALQKACGVSVNVTYVTGTVVRFSRGLGELICRRARISGRRYSPCKDVGELRQARKIVIRLNDRIWSLTAPAG